MSTEFRGSAMGVSGTYKRVGTAPIILKPCEHYIKEWGLIHRRIIQIHGKQNGSIKVNHIM